MDSFHEVRTKEVGQNKMMASDSPLTQIKGRHGTSHEEAIVRHLSSKFNHVYTRWFLFADWNFIHLHRFPDLAINSLGVKSQRPKPQ